MIEAKVIADSIANEVRLTTIELYAPKFLDAEIEKHRSLSSNSSSDRAKSFKRMSSEEPYIPTDVRSEERGMQGYEQVSPEVLENFQGDMRSLYYYVIDHLKPYEGIVHHQHLNRYLLGWAMQHKVITSTEDWWEYFLGLRLAQDADPNIQEVGNRIRMALYDSEPTELEVGDWHLPYVTEVVLHKSSDSCDVLSLDTAIKCSVSRCAKVSYGNQGAGDIEKEIAMAEKLLAKRHFSCFEHQATPMPDDFAYLNNSGMGEWIKGITHIDRDDDLWSGNFRNWLQYRQMI